jgi:hypothetical protein
MNEWNPLQTQLRSWTPRRPSARLKGRIFSRSVSETPARPFAFGWLAPATICLLLLMFVTFNQRNGKLARLAASNQVPMMAVTLSNMSFAAYLPGSFVNDQNAVPPGTFEWTNNGHSHSSIAASPQSRTNDSKR